MNKKVGYWASLMFHFSSSQMWSYYVLYRCHKDMLICDFYYISSLIKGHTHAHTYQFLEEWDCLERQTVKMKFRGDTQNWENEVQRWYTKLGKKATLMWVRWCRRLEFLYAILISS
jgi:hypothetical protein